MEDCMRKSAGLVAVAALCAGPALADGFSYNNLELDFISTEIEEIEPGVDLEGDGIGFSGEVEFGQTIHGFASVSDVDYDDDVNIDTLSIGLGFNQPVAPALDVVSGVSYERLKVSVAGLGSEREEGIGLGAGLRGRVGDKLELMAGVKYNYFNEDLDDTTIQLGGRYYFSRKLAVGLDYSENDDGDTWILALRYDFGDRY
jgi:hypothetical protein